MSSFPSISRPCPYKARLSEVMEGDWCRMCQRQVTDLSAMTEGEVSVFLENCARSGAAEVCISYRAPVRTLLGAAAALSMAAVPLAAVAEAGAANPPASTASTETPSGERSAINDTAPNVASEEPTEIHDVFVGGYAIIEAERDTRQFPQPLEMSQGNHS